MSVPFYFVSWLLNVLYGVLLLIFSPWIVYRAMTTGRYREGFGEKMLGRTPRCESLSAGPVVWLHAVSVGEVNLLPALIARLEESIPGVQCCISTTTKTGMEVARKRFSRYPVFYFPLDFSWSVAQAFRRIRPDLIVLAELEVWPNFVRLAHKRGVPVIVSNGRISDHSFQTYRRFRWLLRPVFSRLNQVLAIDEQIAQRFEAMGTPKERIEVVGSMKFDNARTNRNIDTVTRLKSLTSDHWNGICNGDTIFLAGSTQNPEEEIVLNVFLSLTESHPELKLIIVPRHPERFEAVAGMLTDRGVLFARRTQLTESGDVHNEQKCCLSGSKILLVDTVGELGSWWGTSEIAFVGGSLGNRGGQNMIEPAGFAVAIAFGPNTQNFRDVVGCLLDRNAAVVVNNGPELRQFVERCADDVSYRSELGRRAQNVVLDQQGAISKTVHLIESVLNNRIQEIN